LDPSSLVSSFSSNDYIDFTLEYSLKKKQVLVLKLELEAELEHIFVFKFQVVVILTYSSYLVSFYCKEFASYLNSIRYQPWLPLYLARKYRNQSLTNYYWHCYLLNDDIHSHLRWSPVQNSFT